MSVYGQELNYTTWRLARMNLAIRGIDAHVEQGDTLHDDRFPDLKADFLLANPPFNVSDWRGEHLREDKRWQHGVPPVGNANFAWVQHFVHHLAPRGIAEGVQQKQQQEQRKNETEQQRKDLHGWFVKIKTRDSSPVIRAAARKYAEGTQD